jgi:hypothetical protein
VPTESTANTWRPHAPVFVPARGSQQIIVVAEGTSSDCPDYDELQRFFVVTDVHGKMLPFRSAAHDSGEC